MPDPLSGFAPGAIAAALAERLGPALPASMTLTSAGAVVRITTGGTTVATDLARFGERRTLSAEEAESATWAVLSTIQDAVSETLTVFWPAPGALPRVRIRDGRISAWFGSEADPALRVDVVPGGDA